jgi:hypothetical protein
MKTTITGWSRVATIGLAIAILASALVVPFAAKTPGTASAHGAPYERTCTLPSGTRLYYLNGHQSNHLQEVLRGVDGARAVAKLGGWFGRGFQLPWWIGTTNLSSYNVWLADRASGWQGVKIGEAKWGPFTVGLLVAPKYQGANC